MGDWIEGLRPDLVVLAGYMQLLSPDFVGRFRDRIVNVHPALLPAFPGLDAIGQALKAGAGVTGCTVHRVTLAVDAGPILGQATVPIGPGETHDSLAAKVHAAEHALLPSVIAKLSHFGSAA